MRTCLVLVFCLMALPALAQQPTPPEQLALGSKLMLEINAGLQCQAALIKVQAELDELKKAKKDETVPPPASPTK